MQSPVGDAPDPTHEITELLAAHAGGSREAFDRLIALVYDDLRRIARGHLAREPEGHTLDTGAVVHETYLRLAEETRAIWPDRVHFFAFVSRVMRHLLVDHARRRSRRKRGGAVVHVPLDDDAAAVTDPVAEMLALDEALTHLATRDRRMARVAECRLFSGMELKEVAEALDVSLSTVERDWRAAKAYLYRTLVPDGRRGPATVEAKPGPARG